MFMKVEKLDLVNVIEIFFSVYYTSNPFSQANANPFNKNISFNKLYCMVLNSTQSK